MATYNRLTFCVQVVTWNFVYHKQSQVSMFQIKYTLNAPDTLAHDKKINNQFMQLRRMLNVNMCIKERKDR